MSIKAEELLNMLIDISNTIRANKKIEVFNEEIKNLTIGQGHTIQILYFSNGKTVGELAKISSVTLATMSENIKRLENLGLIKREHDLNDRRRVYVYITQKGKKLIEKHERIYLKYLDLLLKELNDEEKKIIKQVLNKIINLLKKFK